MPDPLSDDFDARFGAATAAPVPPAPQSNVPPLTVMQTPAGPQPLPAAPAPPQPPPWVAGGAAARPQVAHASPELNEAIAASIRNVEEGQRLVRERQAAQAPVIDAALRDLAQPLPQRQPAQQPPPVPKREEILSGAEQWMMALATVAGVMGGRGRTHATNAIAAMTGAIEGLSEGNSQKFEQNMKVWDAENKRVDEINTASRQEYLDVLNDRKMRAEEKNMALALIAQRYDDKVVQSLGDDWQRIAQIVQTRDQLNQTADTYEQNLRGIGSRFGRGAATSTASEIDLLAARYLSGDRDWNKGLSALSGIPAAVIARAAAVKDGSNPLSPEVIAQAQDVTRAGLQFTSQQAGAKSTGVRVANLERLQYSVIAVGNEAVRASDAVPRGSFVPANRLMQIGRAAISDPAQRQFLIAHEALVDTWGQMLKPQGIVDVGLRERLTNDLNTADSPATYRAAVDEIKKLIGLERQALEALQTRDPAAFEAVMRGENSPVANAAVDAAVRTMVTVHPDPNKIQRTQTGVQWSVP